MGKELQVCNEYIDSNAGAVGALRGWWVIYQSSAAEWARRKTYDTRMSRREKGTEPGSSAYTGSRRSRRLTRWLAFYLNGNYLQLNLGLTGSAVHSRDSEPPNPSWVIQRQLGSTGSGKRQYFFIRPCHHVCGEALTSFHSPVRPGRTHIAIFSPLRRVHVSLPIPALLVRRVGDTMKPAVEYRKVRGYIGVARITTR